MAAQYRKWIWAKTSNYEMQHQFWRLDSLGAIERTYTTPLLKPGTTIPWKMYPPFDFVQTKCKGWVVATCFLQRAWRWGLISILDEDGSVLGTEKVVIR
jgi:hypothetical protein